ncbi:HAMP domain-containing sensor histidine kinase [Actinocrinis sp.]|uniref:sensor histidine kinase n=1 Tax=Actinocrinis sp. TaxID=1920516 RepID=UPI002D2E6D85|nr:HAMP domain-containing sensor histidine kinase [Actinocrinis sp.]HZP52406.1 HAMP domain-containing sensor histidine kinase [Actinocrinis sp.]
MPRTLRGRLTLGLVAILALLCAGIGLATTTVLNHYLVSDVDQQLAEAGGRYAASLEHAGSGGIDANRGDTRAQTPGTLGVRLVGSTITEAAVVDGDSDDATGSIEDRVTLSAQDEKALAALPTDGSAHTLDLSSVGEYRIRAQVGLDGDVLITGLPLARVEQTVQQLAGAEMAMFAAALALAAIVAAVWVRLTLRPLDRVARTAERVSGLSLASGEVELSVRVPDEDPATEVGRVGASLNRMLGHIGDALAKRHAVEARLREFAADASHELRTPVAAIRGHAELAQRHPGEIPEPVRRSLDRIEAEAQRMGVLVDDLLLLARIDAGRPLAREQVDLTRLALDAVEDARAAAPGHRWRLELSAEPTAVVGDSHRLAQAIANLLANARTHTPEGTEVTLRLDGGEASESSENEANGDEVPGADKAAAGVSGASAVSEVPEEVRLSITDTGPGLSPEVAARAFDRFVRGDRARSRASGSTGLGLAITRAIAEAHGGRVELETHPGHTVFTIVLPAVPPASERPENGRPQ